MRRSKFSFIQDKDDDVPFSSNKKKQGLHRSGQMKTPPPEVADSRGTSAHKSTAKPVTKHKPRLMLQNGGTQVAETSEISKSKMKTISSWKKLEPKLPHLLGSDKSKLSKSVSQTAENSVNSSAKWQTKKLTGTGSSLPYELFSRKSKKKKVEEGLKPFFVIRDYPHHDKLPDKHLNSHISQRSKLLEVDRHLGQGEPSTDIHMGESLFKKKYGEGLLKFVRDEEDKYMQAKQAYLNKKKKAVPEAKHNWDIDGALSASQNSSWVGSENGGSNQGQQRRYQSDHVISHNNAGSMLSGAASHLVTSGHKKDWLGFNIFDKSRSSVQNQSYLEHMKKSKSAKHRIGLVCSPSSSVIWVKKQPDRLLKVDLVGRNAT